MTSMNKTIAILACFVMVAMPVMAIVDTETFYSDAGSSATIKFEGCPDGVASKFVGTFTPPTPQREGYVFKYWTCEGETYYAGVQSTLFKSYSSSGIPDVVVMTPVWEAISYNVTFKDGATTVRSTVCYYDSPIGELPVLSKDGYDLGWSTSGLVNDVVSADTIYRIPHDQTFYAVWTEKMYRISFFDGEMEICQSIQRSYNSELGDLPDPLKKGNSFVGWSLDKGSNETVSSSTILNKASDMNLYAIWKVNDYNITFLMPDGKEFGTKSVTYGNVLGDMPVPTMDGRSFLGWSTDGTEEKIVSADWVCEDDISLYAVFSGAVTDSSGNSMPNDRGDAYSNGGLELSFDNPTSVAILILIIAITAGLCLLVYRKGIL